MATITINTPPVHDGRIVAAFAQQYGYQAIIPDGLNLGGTMPNPENKMQFFRRMVIAHIVEVVANYEAQTAGANAAAAAVAKARAEVVPT